MFPLGKQCQGFNTLMSNIQKFIQVFRLIALLMVQSTTTLPMLFLASLAFGTRGKNEINLMGERALRDWGVGKGKKKKKAL